MDWGQLIDDLKMGNNAVLRICYLEHGSYCMTRLARENRCSDEDAEDIFIEAVMVLREKLLSGQVERLTNLRAYLYKTCHNMLLVKLAREARFQRKMADIEHFYYGTVDQEEDLPPFNPQLLEITREAIAFLTEKCQKIIQLFYVDNLRMEAIAEVMGFSSANVAKTSKSRCYKRMMEKAQELKSTTLNTVDQ